MPVRHLHILTPGPSRPIESLHTDDMASIRLRIAPAAQAIVAQGGMVTMGDQCPAEASDILVSKIGAADITTRAKHWLSQIEIQRSNGNRIILDYTDHHLASSSPMSPFYRAVMAAIDVIVTPTPALNAEIKTHSNIDATCLVIDDLLEFSPRPPKTTAASARHTTALWFGHPSNAKFLCELIENWPQFEKPCELLVVSSQQTLQILKSHPFKEAPKITIKMTPWSRDILSTIADEVDFSVIPSSMQSVKQFASNNRLVTSLALGLPTLATTLPSYQEFSDYFLPLTHENILKLIGDPTAHTDCVSAFQNNVCSRFSLENIILKWQQLFS